MKRPFDEGKSKAEKYVHSLGAQKARSIGMYASYSPKAILNAASRLPASQIATDMAEQMDAEVRRITRPENVLVAARNNAIGWKYEDKEKYYAQKVAEEQRRPGAKPIVAAASPSKSSETSKMFNYNQSELEKISKLLSQDTDKKKTEIQDQ